MAAAPSQWLMIPAGHYFGTSQESVRAHRAAAAAADSDESAGLTAVAVAAVTLGATGAVAAGAGSMLQAQGSLQPH